MRKVDAGVPFDLVVVCNGGDRDPFSLPAAYDGLGWRVFNRENVGFNIAAWDHGWRNADGYEYYLFVQDDCYLKQRQWLSRFESRFDQDRRIGLLGEMVVYDQMTWDYVRATTYEKFWGDPGRWPEPAHPIDTYKALFDRQGIPWSETCTHLPSIILFTSRRVLDEIDGLPFFGPSYREAVAGEFAISRLVESKGYRIAKVTDYPFEVIGHPQWSVTGKLRDPTLRGVFRAGLWHSKRRLRLILGHKDRAQRPGVGPPVRSAR